MSGDERNPIDALAEEFAERFRRGEQPSVEDYVARYPHWAEQIRELFPALLVMEKLKPAADPTGPFACDATGQIAPVRLGEYRIVRELGRGGMGVVYEAVQESLGRHVALKVLPGSGLVNATFLERFRREARAVGQLQHPNIVPVHGVGEADGVHYYAMQFVPGQSLDSVLASRRSSGNTTTAVTAGDPHREAARLALQVADALAHAHTHGILHRDIKPSNLLLDERGTVWVTDFGLAKAEGAEELTGTGDIVGTLRFMAPERFDGRSLPQSDVYSLGLTLYELLTLRPAFDDPLKPALIHKVLHTEAVPPRQHDRGIPRDLETIVLKCMARDPERRYATAGELADDLRAYLDGRPIKARRSSWLERGWRWCRRNPAVAGLSVAVVLLALLLGYAATHPREREQAPAPVMVLPDPGYLANFRGQNERSYYIQVVGDPRFSIYGSDIYTDDSALRTVVVHAGILKPGEEGVVKVTILPGQATYQAVLRHGISSMSYQAWPGSYRVEATTLPPRVELRRALPGAVRDSGHAPLPNIGLMAYRGRIGESIVLELVGSTSGYVWGTDVYTDDSDPGTAAVHAGVLKVGEAGRVKVTFLPGEENYKGSQRNGVTSGDWNVYGGSYKIEKPAK